MLNYSLLGSPQAPRIEVRLIFWKRSDTGPAETMVKVDLTGSGKFKIYSQTISQRGVIFRRLIYSLAVTISHVEFMTMVSSGTYNS